MLMETPTAINTTIKYQLQPLLPLLLLLFAFVVVVLAIIIDKLNKNPMQILAAVNNINASDTCVYAKYC